MNDSITREQAEERLKSSNVKALRAEVLDMLFPAPSPPPFIPKEGEVIAVWNSDAYAYRLHTFVKMAGDKYSCETDGVPGDTTNWAQARPLTDKERRI